MAAKKRKLVRRTLNGGAGMVVHVVDRCQPTGPKVEALCKRIPGGGKTRMGRLRSRWRQVGPMDSHVNCTKCLSMLAELGISPDDVE